jgi:hypothetical protein
MMVYIYVCVCVHPYTQYTHMDVLKHKEMEKLFYALINYIDINMYVLMHKEMIGLLLCSYGPLDYIELPFKYVHKKIP